MTLRTPWSARRLEKVQRADDVDLRVVCRVRDGLRHLRLRGVVVDELGPESRDRLFDLRLVAKVDAVDGLPPGSRCPRAGAEVVEHGDLVPGRDVGVDDVGADEPGAPGHQNSHGLDCNGFTC